VIILHYIRLYLARSLLLALKKQIAMNSGFVEEPSCHKEIKSANSQMSLEADPSPVEPPDEMPALIS